MISSVSRGVRCREVAGDVDAQDGDGDDDDQEAQWGRRGRGRMQGCTSDDDQTEALSQGPTIYWIQELMRQYSRRMQEQVRKEKLGSIGKGREQGGGGRGVRRGGGRRGGS